MRFSKEYRSIARRQLSDKWGKAIIAAMIMYFLDASMAFVNGGVTVNYDDKSVDPLTKLINHPAWARYAGFFAAVGVVLTIIGVFHFVVGGAASLGYARFNKGIIDGEDVEALDVFSQMKRLLDGFVYKLLTVIYLILWSLLFIVPGIVKIFSYAMTPYIMNDYPQLKANEAITMSRKVMNGKKLSLFSLYLSFIGWAILANSPNAVLAFIANSRSYDFIASPLTFGAALMLTAVAWAGNCMLGAYARAAEAAFYKDAIEDYLRTNGEGENGPGTGYGYADAYGQNRYDGIPQNGSAGYGTDSNYAGRAENINSTAGYGYGYDGVNNASANNGSANSGSTNNSGGSTAGYGYGFGGVNNASANNGSANSGNTGSSSVSSYNYGNTQGGRDSSTVENPFEMK